MKNNIANAKLMESLEFLQILKIETGVNCINLLKNLIDM